MTRFLEKAAVLAGCAIAGGTTGLIVPLLFDRDVGGALAAELLGIAGLVVGAGIGFFVIRRRFD